MIRHTQAAAAPVDRDRPLTAQGARNAGAIGAWLERGGFVPDRVVVSPALRARQTWERAAASLVLDGPPTADERIYENTIEAVLAAITETPDHVQTLVIVGHNPSMGELASVLDDGQGDPGARRSLQAGFPTGAVAVFEVGGTYGELEPGAATLSSFDVPAA
jgi:phosphohistidine phosphatase